VTPSDAAIDSLLIRLDHRAVNVPYPPAGLRIWGEYSDRAAYRDIVRAWLAEQQPEAQR